MKNSLITINPLLIFITALTGLIIISYISFWVPMNQWVQESTYSLKNPFFISFFIVSTLVLDILLPIPSSFINIFAGASLGIFYGTTAIWFGLSLGCCFGYYIGRISGATIFPNTINDKDVQKVRHLCNNSGAYLLIFMRAVPVLAEASVISAGMIGMSFIKFFVLTSLANAGLAFTYVYISVSAISSQSYWLVILGTVSVPIVGWVVFNFAEKLIGLFRYIGNIKGHKVTRNIINSKFEVNYDYPVMFTENIFNQENTSLLDVLLTSELNNQTRNIVNAMVFIDEGLYQKMPMLPQNIKDYFDAHRSMINLVGESVIVPGGEPAKEFKQIDVMQYEMLKHKLDRHAYVIIVGGGSVLDAVGYAAATFHRGIKVIRLPSTVLAQNDAGIGVKNGINAHGIKNLIGSFAPPQAVINDSVFLKTLSKRDLLAGIAEAVKVAAIKDNEFFKWLEKNVYELARFETSAMKYMIFRCAELHLEQISYGGDPFEQGNARPLDYGHWCAHKLESLSNYEIKHGEAVAIGMAMDARYSYMMGMMKESESSRLIQLLERLGFKLWHDALDTITNDNKVEILLGLEEFRQHLGGTLSITQLTSMGEAIEVNEIKSETMLKSKDWLKAYVSGYDL